ncbi:hypothetical protein LZK98_04515 [Sphingomonas cannabina]|nr:hypothetical protein [Sphingomonas cannabina]UIJ46216.1 hypothetical protein LZK98_04515 [Sphingomonas cannabina]
MIQQPHAILDGFPTVEVEDREFWNPSDLPMLNRIEPRDALAGDRVFLEALAIVDDASDVKLIVEDTGPAAPVTLDC